MCVCMIHIWTNCVWNYSVLSDSEKDTWTSNTRHCCDLTSTASPSFSLCKASRHQVALAPASASSALSLSFDMLLIWQLKVSFVASTSAFMLLSAPSEPYAPLPHDCSVVAVVVERGGAIYCFLITVWIKAGNEVPPATKSLHITLQAWLQKRLGAYEGTTMSSFIISSVEEPMGFVSNLQYCLTYNRGSTKCTLPFFLSRDMFVFIYPISPPATAWPCIRLTLAPGVCNACVHVL